MGLFNRQSDDSFAKNAAAEIKKAVDDNDNGRIGQMLRHLTAEGDVATAAAAIDELRRKHAR